MKIVFAAARREGFIATIALRFENGLVLRSKDLLWLDSTERTETLTEMKEVIDLLKEKGFKISNEVELVKILGGK